MNSSNTPAFIRMLISAVGVMITLVLATSATYANEPEAEAEGLAQLSIDVYKTPNCGCCQKWVDYLSVEGFSSTGINQNSLNALKTEKGIAGRYRSCHTGIVSTLQGEYVFEGHVPAEYIKQFLANPPEGAIGLSVPGMPIGSPGMEMGDRRDYYQVLQLNADGSDSVYAHVNAQ